MHTRSYHAERSDGNATRVGDEGAHSSIGYARAERGVNVRAVHSACASVASKSSNAVIESAWTAPIFRNAARSRSAAKAEKATIAEIERDASAPSCET
jgi:hypothetical protein